MFGIPVFTTERANVFSAIERERKRQDDKFGVQTHDDLFWLGIITEEHGEVAKAIIENRDEASPHYLASLVEAAYDTRVREELVQVAAVAVAWIEEIDRRRAAGQPHERR